MRKGFCQERSKKLSYWWKGHSYSHLKEIEVRIIEHTKNNYLQHTLYYRPYFGPASIVTVRILRYLPLRDIIRHFASLALPVAQSFFSDKYYCVSNKAHKVSISCLALLYVVTGRVHWPRVNEACASPLNSLVVFRVPLAVFSVVSSAVKILKQHSFHKWKVMWGKCPQWRSCLNKNTKLFLIKTGL